MAYIFSGGRTVERVKDVKLAGHRQIASRTANQNPDS
jgi:hypothetical protein